MHSPENLQSDTLRDHKLMVIGALAAGAAHDLNNLLTSIGSFTYLLDQKVTDPKLRDYIHLIDRTVNRACSLTNGILSTIKEEEQELYPIDPIPCLRDICALVKRMLPRQVTMAISLPEEGQQVLMRRTDLAQILLNLLVNARDALGQQGEVGIHGVYEDGALLLSVEDNGPGIPEDVLPRIWETFFTTKSEEQGTGLGLSIVQQLTQAAGRFYRLLIAAWSDGIPSPFPTASLICGRIAAVLRFFMALVV